MLRRQFSRLANPAHHPRIGPYWRLLRLDKPVGTLLLLWPTLAGLWIAGDGRPDLVLVLIFAAGCLLMRSAGCAINDVADRHFDGQIARTRQRPLATRELRPRQALVCCAALGLLALGLVLFTNRLTIALAFGGALLAAIYPFLKRVTHLPQIWLGLAMNWGILMAYSAQTGTLHPGIGLFYLGAVLWCVAYDCFYAMADREDDRRLGLKSIAILFGEHDRLMCAGLQGLSLLAFYAAAGRLELGAAYLLSLAAIAGLFAYQHYLIRDRAPHACTAAFRHNRWVALALFIGVLVDTRLLA
ncbi:MAG: 4-hydroxybenzoate octaprenyltransferase [Cellvibrionales bacterium]|nr:4-hydroxybenzoate octaprenyltransferase [Cellvibrionales bacterium]